VLKEKQLAVGDARQTGAKPAVPPEPFFFGLNRVLIFLPIDPVWRIAEHIVEFLSFMSVVRQRVAKGDLFRVVAGH